MGGHRFLLLVTLALLLGAAACDRRIDVDFNYALENKDYDRAEALLGQGADIDARFIQSDGYTTLMMVVKDKTNPATVTWLLEHGADLEQRSFSGRTALHVAANEGRAGHVEILLGAGAAINARSHRGQTPLRLARDKGHTATERILREAGGQY